MKDTSVSVHYDSFYFRSTEELHLGYAQYNSARTHPSILCQIQYLKTDVFAF